MKYRLVLLIMLNLLGQVGAQASMESLGDVAEHALLPITMLAQVFYAICYVVGSGLVVGSLLRYKEHRANPQKVNFSKPVMFLLFGLFLVALPTLAQYSDAIEAFRLD